LTIAVGFIGGFLGIDLRGRAAPVRRERNTMKGLLGLIIVVWLVIGAVAAWQRGYFGGDEDTTCKSAGETTLTILAGPLNYVGVNPKIKCNVPEPSP